jgi:hypothetical protein
MKWPIPHLYEHGNTVARMTVARTFEGEDWVFFARIETPETMALTELQCEIDRFKNLPVPEVPSFKRQVRLSELPFWLRRFLWWWALNSTGARHAYRFGTFAMTSVSAMGAVAVQPKLLSGTTLTFGPVGETGDVDVRIVFDHRLFDGAMAATLLSQLESILKSDIADELRSLNSNG